MLVDNEHGREEELNAAEDDAARAELLEEVGVCVELFHGVQQEGEAAADREYGYLDYRGIERYFSNDAPWPHNAVPNL